MIARGRIPKRQAGEKIVRGFCNVLKVNDQELDLNVMVSTDQKEYSRFSLHGDYVYANLLTKMYL